MLRGGLEFRSWTVAEYLAALMVDAIQANTWTTAAVANPKRKPRKPKPIPRPGERRRRVVTVAQIAGTQHHSA